MPAARLIRRKFASYASRTQRNRAQTSLQRHSPELNGSRISTISPPSARLKAATFPPWKRTARSVIAKSQPTPPVRRPRASSRR